jgi:ornithine cyclodeaminase/alanine dehydrogenase-like protein (mu-crystallin family)
MFHPRKGSERPEMFLSEDAVRERLSYERLIPAMKQALIDLFLKKAVQPLRMRLPVPQQPAQFLVMPAIYGEVMGAKLVSVFPGNASRGLESHFAVIQLFRTDTGEPLATMDARLITEMRTAAVSAVATELLAGEDARVLAILGSGVQARAHVTALQRVRRFEEIRIWSRNQENARKLAEQVGAKVMTAEEAVRGADVVVTVTGSSEPVLCGRWLKEGAHVNAVGAVGQGRRELDDEAMKGFLAVESREAAGRESEEIRLSGAVIDAELGELLTSATVKRRAGRTIFKSVGLAVEDMAAAKLVYDTTRG